MRHPTREAVRTHVALQERLFRAVTPGCQATGRSAHCPTCRVQRIVYDLPSTGGVVGCGTCGTEFSVRRGPSRNPDCIHGVPGCTCLKDELS